MMLADLSLIDIVLSLLSAALTFFLIVYYLHHVVSKIPACLLRDFLCHLVYWLDGKKTQYSNPEKNCFRENKIISGFTKSIPAGILFKLGNRLLRGSNKIQPKST